jgi:hypothetical protein
MGRAGGYSEGPYYASLGFALFHGQDAEGDSHGRF